MRIGALILDERQIQFGGAVGATKNEHADREALRHVLKPLDHGDMVQRSGCGSLTNHNVDVRGMGEAVLSEGKKFLRGEL